MFARRSLPLILVTLSLVALAGPSSAGAATARQEKAMREQAVRWALTQVGLRERGTTNCSPRINRWTMAMRLSRDPCPPWCGAFVHEAFRQAGVNLSSRLIDPERSLEDAFANRRGLRRIAISKVRRGDILFFAFRPGMKASHEAIVTGRPGGGYADTVEGNVGHKVVVKRRGLRYPVAAARVVMP